MKQGFVLLLDAKVDCKKDSTPMKVKWAESTPCFLTFFFLNLFFEAQLKLHKKKRLYRCRASNINIYFNLTLFYFGSWFSWEVWWGYRNKTQRIHYIAPSIKETKKRKNFQKSDKYQIIRQRSPRIIFWSTKQGILWYRAEWSMGIQFLQQLVVYLQCTWTVTLLLARWRAPLITSISYSPLSDLCNAKIAISVCVALMFSWMRPW